MRSKYLPACLLALLLCAGGWCSGQASSADSLVAEFRWHVQSGLAGHRTSITGDDETMLAYCTLMAACPVQALIPYTNDANAVVRAEVFSGLVQKNADTVLLKAILDRHQDDTASFTKRGGCVVITWNVKEYMQFAWELSAKGLLPVVDFKARLNAIKARMAEAEREPHLIIPGRRHDVITAPALSKVDRIVIAPREFRIVSLHLMVRDHTFRVKNALHRRVRRRIRHLKPGERIYFDDIMIEGPDHRHRLLGSFSLTVI